MNELQIEEVEQNSFPSCCIQTMDNHSAHNHMIVCDECNDLIKLFSNGAAFRNYLKFCQSKDREVLSGRYKDFYVIIVNKKSGKF